MSFRSFLPAKPSPGQKRQGPEVFERDFIPQAILSVGISYFSESLGFAIEESEDDLDRFVGIAFVDDFLNTPVAVRHYAGHPAGTVTVYFPKNFDNAELITAAVRHLLNRFKLFQDALYWERQDGPDL
jgi:hypothetical protein